MASLVGSYVTTLESIKAARDRIRPYGIVETPVLTSSALSRLSGHELFFKCELFQKTGSFKARGATNACALMTSGEPVVTHSSGNHAQAIAFAAAATGRKATIVMPTNAPAPKRAATEGYGAEVRLCSPLDRAAAAAAASSELGAKLVHPSEDVDVIAGQGTVALEALEQIAALRGGSSEQPLDVLVIPVGGGGLAAGCTICAKALWPGIVVVGAEPAAMDDAARSKESGALVANEVGATTVADGLRTQLGPNTWPVVRDLVDAVLTTSEEDILSATALVWSRMKLQIEPSAGVAVAVSMSDGLRAIIQAKCPPAEGKAARVGVILCGGNVDPAFLAPLLATAPPFPTGALASNQSFS